MVLRAPRNGKEPFVIDLLTASWLETARQEGNKEGKEDKRLWSISDTITSNIKKL